MAHVEKRGPGRWRARYRAPDGRERSKTFDRRIDAERFLTSIEHSKLVGNYVDPAAGKITFKCFAEKWRTIQVHRSGTAQSVEGHLRLHVYPTIGQRPIAAIRQSEVQALVTKLTDKLAPSTIEVVYGRIAAVFRAAVRDRVINRTPCIEIKLPPKHASDVLEVLQTSQVKGLAAAMPERYQVLVLAGAGTGLRPGELFGLTVDRIDFLRGTLRVDQQLVRRRALDDVDDGDDAAVNDGGPSVEFGPLKTKASYRTIPLARSVSEAIAAHLARFPVEDSNGNPLRNNPDRLVFTNERGAPIQQYPFSVVWEDARTTAKLPEWATPHDLRHYFASVLIRKGLSVKVVQARLGHKSAKTTLDTYGHLFEDEEDRTRDAIDAEFDMLSDDTGSVDKAAGRR
ncbi:MAG TPA: site-specific integrase [Acidimicrobiales bacterium]|nr:site-specific integrase [Acidimicrobiales bacterium]